MAGRDSGGPDSRSLPCRLLGLEPAECLRSQIGRCSGADVRLVLCLAGSGQRGRAGGIVAVLGLAVVAQLGVGFQRSSPELGGGGEAFCIVAHLSQLQPLGEVLRAVLSLRYGREPFGQAAKCSAVPTHFADGYRQPDCLEPSSCPRRNIASDPAKSPWDRRACPRLQWASA